MARQDKSLMNNTNIVNDIRNVLGADLLAFILGVDVDQLSQLAPNKRQSRVLSELKSYMLALGNPPYYMQSTLINNCICSYITDLKTSLATHWHYFCLNTRIPEFESVKDSAERSLMTLARDVYPKLLIKKHQFDTIASISDYKHPSWRQFSADIFRSRNPIGKLFPDALTYRHYKTNPTATLSLNCNMILSNKRGGTVSAGMIPESILTSSVYLPDSVHDSLEIYCLSVQKNYQKLRRTIGRRFLKVKTIIGLSNVELSSDIQSYNIAPNIKIRRATPIDRLTVFANLDEPDLIIEIEDRVDILDSFPMTEDSTPRYERHRGSIDEFYVNQQRDLDRIRLAMLLASVSADELIAPGYLFTTALFPITPDRNLSISSHRWPMVRYGRQTIDRRRADLIRKWISKLNKLPDTLDVSVKRLISATMERANDADAFVDAVVVWENLFGGKRETGLRIQGSMSLLLGPKSRTCRKNLIREISGLYDRRSRLIHGDSGIDNSTISVDCARSIELALKSLKLVLNNKNLLRASNSETRSKLIMFGVC